MQGWIKLHRKIFESSVFQNPIYFKVWIWCLLRANHKDTKVPFNNQDIDIKKGQFITGLYSASKEIFPKSRKPKLQTIRTALTYLKSTNRITTKPTNKFTIITVVNWEQYQCIDEPTNKQTNTPTNKPVTNEQQTSNKPLTTDKKDKNIKNDNNEKNNTLSAKADEEFNLKEKIKIMVDDKDYRMWIIALYWVMKNKQIENSEQYSKAIKRELQASSNLKGYSKEKIKDTMEWLKKNADFKWTLESVHKYIDEDLSALSVKSNTVDFV